jgi:hypothetical protein
LLADIENRGRKPPGKETDFLLDLSEWNAALLTL